MNTVENHLPLEQAIILDEALKKAGVEMEIEFAWTDGSGHYDDVLDYSQDEKYKLIQIASDTLNEQKELYWESNWYPAPTLSEMIELLPKEIRDYSLTLIFDTAYEEWICDWYKYGDVPICWDSEVIENRNKITGDTLLEAVYEALLWCLREGHVLGKG